MRKVCACALLIFVVCLANVMCGEGFVADTLVSTSHSSIAIQKLTVGDHVQTCTFNDSAASAPVANVISHDVDMFIRLAVDDDTIDLTHDQLLFVPLQRTWLPASDVRPGMYLLGTPLRAIRVHAVTKIEEKRLMHTISLKDHHNFLVGQHGIVAHNFGECALLAVEATEGVTFLSAFFASNPLVAPITIGVGGAGLVGYLIWNAVSEIKESRKAKRDKGKNSGGGGQPQEPKNNDPEYNPATVRAEAIALLKAIDESKERAVEVFNRTYEWLQTSPGLKTIEHCFRKNCEHNFGPLFTQLGGKTDTAKLKFIADITKKLIGMGSRLALDEYSVFTNVLIEYSGELITVQGRVIDGMLKVSTMFIQPQHVR